MTMRHRAGEVFLWLAILFVGTMCGASVYQRISLIPEWGGSLPQSVITTFQGTGAGEATGRFWKSVMGPSAVFVLLATILAWPVLTRRSWLIAGSAFFFAMLIWTAVYFIPQGVVPLMERGGEGMSPEEITSMAQAWIFWDWFRMAGTLAAYLCLLKAATAPVAGTKL